MIDLYPEAVFITDEVAASPPAMTRAQRMAAAMHAPEAQIVRLSELNDLAVERGWTAVPRWGTVREPRDPDFVFTMGRFPDDPCAGDADAAWPHLACRDLAGRITLRFRSDGEPEFKAHTRGVVCQSAWQLHSMQGCPFRCAYCNFGGVNRVNVNIEDYIERLGDWLALDPSQSLYKWDNHGDVTVLEPEYAAARLFVDHFAQQEDRYLEIYVGKSDNVEHLLPLEHNGKTILQWSVAGRSQAELFEPRAAAWDARIDAARACQQAGYLVRFRLSPIIPVREWRDETALLVERIFERTTPDVISLCVFGWMGLNDAEACLDFDRLDPQFVDAMRAADPFLQEMGYTTGGARPIPHEPRYVLLSHIIGHIRRISPNTVVALCLETEQMWQALADQIGQTSVGYVCNCGPKCTPGRRAYDRLVPTRPVAPTLPE